MILREWEILNMRDTLNVIGDRYVIIQTSDLHICSGTDSQSTKKKWQRLLQLKIIFLMEKKY